MFTSLIIGALFGFGTDYASGPITQHARSRFALNEREATILAFGAMLLAAAIVATLIQGHPRAFWLVGGGLLGAFALRIKAGAETVNAQRNAAANASDEDTNGTAGETTVEAEVIDETPHDIK